MERLRAFALFLITEEKSNLTQEKYLRDVRKFLSWIGTETISKEAVLNYKAELVNTYAVSSVNSMLSSLNRFLHFSGLGECCVKTLKCQREVFSSEEKELSREEYSSLLCAASGDRCLWLLMQTICATGIRVSEHQFITVEALKQGSASVQCKGKRRTVLIPRKLCRELLRYCRQKGIRSGSVFLNSLGKPLDRSRIWAMMKKLCEAAKVKPQKVFPHNLRHLFARLYYSMEKDIVRLADILGHSNINTTRIYTRESCEKHRRQLEKMPLLFIT